MDGSGGQPGNVVEGIRQHAGKLGHVLGVLVARFLHHVVRKIEHDDLVVRRR